MSGPSPHYKQRPPPHGPPPPPPPGYYSNSQHGGGPPAPPPPHQPYPPPQNSGRGGHGYHGPPPGVGGPQSSGYNGHYAPPPQSSQRGGEPGYNHGPPPPGGPGQSSGYYAPPPPNSQRGGEPPGYSNHGPPPPNYYPQYRGGPPPTGPHPPRGSGAPPQRDVPPHPLPPHGQAIIQNNNVVGPPSYANTASTSHMTSNIPLQQPSGPHASHINNNNNMSNNLSSASTYTSMDDDKGRGSYKCGRCGVPKKGHICPYQPKVKRRPGDPMPEMKCISTQVEMDEFMTLRRLNIEIQGYPESYAAEPMDMVGSEVGPLYSPPPQATIPTQSRDDDGTTNVVRPPLDNAVYVNLGSGGEQQHHQEGGTSKNYENGPLPPSTNETNKRIKTSPTL